MSKKIFKNKAVRNKIYFTSGLFFGIIPFLYIVYLLLGPVVKVIQKDFGSKDMYIISETLNIRSDKSNNSYVIGSYKYGTKVKVYDTFDNQWAEVSVGKKKGFMSLEYLVSPETFYLIDGMFGNDLAQKNISKTAYKKAIATYLRDNNYISNIPPDIRKELYGNKENKEVWQIFAEEGHPKFNSFCYGNFNGNKAPDAAFVIKNINTGKTKLIVLEINTETPGRYCNLLYTKDLKENWFFIKTAYKGQKFMIDTTKKRIILDGILIGTNRNSDLNDKERLLIYDGHEFNIYPQDQNNN